MCIIEGLRTRVGQPKMKCGKLSKCHKNELKSAWVYPSGKHEFSSWPEMHFRVQGGVN